MKIIINRRTPETENAGFDHFNRCLTEFLQSTDKNVLIELKEATASRSVAQNRLAFQWYNDLAKQGDQTTEEYRAECKLTVGVPLLRNESQQFRELYDKVIRPLSYEDKLKCMMSPIDLPVTSQFNVKQFTEYLRQVEQKYSDYRLTKPVDVYDLAMGSK